MTLSTLPALPGLQFPITRRNLGFAVVKQQSISGLRTRFPQRSKPQYQWEISFSLLRDSTAPTLTTLSDGTPLSDGSQLSQTPFAELETLAGFYNSVNGATLPFLYTEPNDNNVTNQQFGVGDGATTQFQLVRTFGGFTEPVYGLPQAEYIVVNHARAMADFVISPTGLVTFTSPPAAGAPLVWTGSFQWLVRFDDDNVDFENFMYQMWQLKKLTFSSEPLP